MDPRRIPKQELDRHQQSIAEKHGIDLYVHYKESEAARLILRPDLRSGRDVSTSTLKRKRRANKIPYVSLGDGTIAYLGVMLCDFIMFGERSVLLWGGQPHTDDPSGSAALPARDGGGPDGMGAAGGSGGTRHQA